jgi:hypothetical protein
MGCWLDILRCNWTLVTYERVFFRVENQLFQTCTELLDERDVEAETGDKFLDAWFTVFAGAAVAFDNSIELERLDSS